MNGIEVAACRQRGGGENLLVGDGADGSWIGVPMAGRIAPFVRVVRDHDFFVVARYSPVLRNKGSFLHITAASSHHGSAFHITSNASQHLYPAFAPCFSLHLTFPSPHCSHQSTTSSSFPQLIAMGSSVSKPEDAPVQPDAPVEDAPARIGIPVEAAAPGGTAPSMTPDGGSHPLSSTTPNEQSNASATVDRVVNHINAAYQDLFTANNPTANADHFNVMVLLRQRVSKEYPMLHDFLVGNVVYHNEDISRANTVLQDCIAALEQRLGEKSHETADLFESTQHHASIIQQRNNEISLLIADRSRLESELQTSRSATDDLRTELHEIKAFTSKVIDELRAQNSTLTEEHSRSTTHLAKFKWLSDGIDLGPPLKKRRLEDDERSHSVRPPSVTSHAHLSYANDESVNDRHETESTRTFSVTCNLASQNDTTAVAAAGPASSKSVITIDDDDESDTERITLRVLPKTPAIDDGSDTDHSDFDFGSPVTQAGHPSNSARGKLQEAKIKKPTKPQPLKTAATLPAQAGYDSEASPVLPRPIGSKPPLNLDGAADSGSEAGPSAPTTPTTPQQQANGSIPAAGSGKKAKVKAMFRYPSATGRATASPSSKPDNGVKGGNKNAPSKTKTTGTTVKGEATSSQRVLVGETVKDSDADSTCCEVSDWR